MHIVIMCNLIHKVLLLLFFFNLEAISPGTPPATF